MVGEAAALVSAMVELSEMEAQGERLARAELRALRAQISPHFIYNALAAVASFIHSRPEEARELLTEFAEFIRYAFARQRAYVTLADELRYVEKYLRLEQARFGERLKVRVQVDPEVLQAVVPVLSLQPLVENAVRHGVERQPEGGLVAIEGIDLDTDVELRVSDSGDGIDPERAPRRARRPRGRASGSATCTARLQSTFGEGYGLEVESTRPGHDGGDDAAEVPRRGARRVRVLAVDDERPRSTTSCACSRRSPAVDRGRVGGVGRGGAGGARRRRGDSTPCSSTCACRASTGSSWRACCGASSARPRSSSSPRSTTPPSTPSSCARSTTWSSRSRARGSTRRSSARRAASAPSEPARTTTRRSPSTRCAAAARGCSPRSSMLYLQAHGDYVRVVSSRGPLPACAARLADLEERWAAPRLRPRAPRLRRQPAARRRGAPAAQRHRRARDGRRRRGADRPPPGRRAAAEAGRVSAPHPARRARRGDRPRRPLPAAADPRAARPQHCSRWSRSAASSARCRCRCSCCPGCRTCYVLGVPLPICLDRPAAVPALHRHRRGSTRAARRRSRRRSATSWSRAIDRDRRDPRRHRRHASGSASTASASRAPRRTCSSPRARSRRGGTRRRSPASTCRRRRFLGIAGLQMKLGAARCGCRSASPPATWRCCCSSPRRCAASAPTRSPTSPRRGCARRGMRAAGRRDRAADRRLLPRAAAQGRRADARRGDRRAVLGRRAWPSARVVALNVALRRHARHHLRAGLPVLGEDVRDRAARAACCCSTSAGCPSARRCSAQELPARAGRAGWSSSSTSRSTLTFPEATAYTVDGAPAQAAEASS